MRARIVLALVLVLAPLLAALGAPGGVEPAEQAVLDHLTAGEMVAARAAAQGLRPGANDSTRARRVDLLELAVALAEADAASDPARVKPIVLGRVERLAERVEARDLPLLRATARALGAPGQVYLTPLLRAARAGIGPRQPRSLLLELSRDADPELRRLAVSALAAQLAPFRARVSAGEDLGPSEQRALSNPELIRALVERLSDRAASGATDQLAADLAASTPGAATALHALVLVEAPALPALRAEAGRSPAARQAIAAIESAIVVRLSRYPRSTWCSAQGAPPREVAASRQACPGCQAALPPSARYCPSCGQRARHGCPACHTLLEPGATWCASCGASAQADPRASACPVCRAALRTRGRYCPECGAEVRADREE